MYIIYLHFVLYSFEKKKSQDTVGSGQRSYGLMCDQSHIPCGFEADKTLLVE